MLYSHLLPCLLSGLLSSGITNTFLNQLKKGKGKVKVVPVLSLTEHHAIKAYWGVEI